MKELEKQYNKDVQNPDKFDFDRRTYMAGGRAALEWVLKDYGYVDCFGQNNFDSDKIKDELGDT